MSSSVTSLAGLVLVAEVGLTAAVLMAGVCLAGVAFGVEVGLAGVDCVLLWVGT